MKNYSWKKLAFVFILLIATFLAVFILQKRQDIRQRAAEPEKLVEQPWAYTYWNLPYKNEGYSDLNWDIKVLRGPNSAKYIWVNYFFIKNGSLGYISLETNGTRTTDGSVGKTASIYIGNAIGSSGPGCDDTVKCSVPFDWVENKVYKISINRALVPDQPGKPGSGGVFWIPTITDTTTNTGTSIGSIKVSPEWGLLEADYYMFSGNLEPITDCNQITYSSVQLGRPYADYSNPVLPISHENYVSDPSNCGGIFSKDIADGVQHDIGNPSVTPGPITPSAMPSSILPTRSILISPRPTSVFFPLPTPDLQLTPAVYPSMDPNQPPTELIVTVNFPGIGPGKNSNPKHLTREVVAGVFNTDNKLVKMGRGFLKYDQKGFFRGKINVGAVPNGVYYVKLISNYTLITLVQPEFQSLHFNKISNLPETKLSMGDYNADLIIDINDYNLALSCFQDKKCPNTNAIDQNDDGKADVTDYNLFLSNFKRYEGD